MTELTRTQVATYAVLVFVVVLVGARALRADGGGTGGARGQSAAPAPGGPVSVGRAPAVAPVVHVAGAVRRPGVYELPAGARVQDALRRAGGARRGAALDQINLAAKLADGQQVVVPARAGGGSAAAAGASPAPGAGGAAGPVSLSSATAEQLDALDGVGPATAQKILAYRSAHGGFRSVDELAQVPGIGPKRLAALRDKVQP